MNRRERERERGTYDPEICHVERASVVDVCVGWNEDGDGAGSDHAGGESGGSDKDGGELHFDCGDGYCCVWLEAKSGGVGEVIWCSCRKECELEAERSVVGYVVVVFS